MAEFIRRDFPNGLVAMAAPLPSRRRMALSIAIDAGSKDEPSERKGGAHLLEHILFKSNEFATTREIARRLEFSGMSGNAATSAHYTSLDFHLPPSGLVEVLALSTQLIRARQYDPLEFETERRGPVQVELMKMEHDHEARYETRVVYPRILEGTPLAEPAIGTFESVAGLGLPDLVAFKDALYVPPKMVVSAAGSFEPEIFFRMVEASLGTHVGAASPKVGWTWALRPGVEYSELPELEEKDRSEGDEAMLDVLLQVAPASHPDSTALGFLAAMIGGGITSRMFEELREKRGIGYAPHAHYAADRDVSYLRASVPGLHPTQVSQAYETIQNIFDEMRRGGFDDTYFEGKRRHCRSAISAALDRTGFLVANGWRRIFDPPYASGEAALARLDALSRTDLIEAAQRNLSGDPLIMVASAPGYKNPFS